MRLNNADRVDFMAFDLKVQHTANSIKLANKFWDFLVFNVGKQIDIRRQSNHIDRWATTFDTFLQTHSFEHVCEVFDYYVKEWVGKRKNGEMPYVYISPDAFIGDFYLIEQRYEWQSRPIPEEQLRPYLLPLRREHWECEWDSLVTAVSKSVYSVRVFLRALGKTNLVDSVKKRIRAAFGDTRQFIIHHFLSWHNNQIEAVWTATITLDGVFGLARKELSRAGYSLQLRKQCLEIIRKEINKEIRK